MNFFKTLGEKPWLDPTMANSDVLAAVDPLLASRTALRFIMGIVSVLFFLFIITYLSRSQYPDFQALAGQPWQPFTDPSRLWLNTGILAASSVAMQWGLWSARREQVNRAVTGVSMALFFAVLFLVAQLELWRHLQGMGYYVNTNPANSYFYLLTAVHGLHLLGGLLVLANVVFRVWYDGALARLSGPLALCTHYWHFLLVVWLLLFALLTSRAETINMLAALCGF
jgi:cytochrome c oxidase subunit 3